MGDPVNYVRIESDVIDLNKLIALVQSPEAGAISTFSGTTRNHHNGKKVLTLEYEAYVPMAEKKMAEICTQIREKWDVCRFGFKIH